MPLSIGTKKLNEYVTVVIVFTGNAHINFHKIGKNLGARFSAIGFCQIKQSIRQLVTG